MTVAAPLIATSARKHGIHDDDMLHAFNHPMFVEDLDEGFVMFVGPTLPATCSRSEWLTALMAQSSSTP